MYSSLVVGISDTRSFFYNFNYIDNILCECLISCLLSLLHAKLVKVIPAICGKMTENRHRLALTSTIVLIKYCCVHLRYFANVRTVDLNIRIFLCIAKYRDHMWHAIHCLVRKLLYGTNLFLFIETIYMTTLKSHFKLKWRIWFHMIKEF